MKRAIYEQLASKIQARINCTITGNNQWFHQHELDSDKLVDDHLPSGSGIDSGNKINYERSTGERIVIESSYHTMDENGYYGRWIDFIIKVTPSLIGKINIDIVGRFGKDQDLKEYLYDVYYTALCEKC